MKITPCNSGIICHRQIKPALPRLSIGIVYKYMIVKVVISSTFGNIIRVTALSIIANNTLSIFNTKTIQYFNAITLYN
jgi:hypothetical protein